jgi:hypothetical protein
LASLPPTQQIYAIAAAIPNRVPPPGALFTNPAIYAWGLDDELAVVAFATKHYDEAYEASIRCVLNTEHPVLRQNAIRNAKAAKEAKEAKAEKTATASAK